MIIDGVEVLDNLVPARVVKAMERKWADALVNDGCLRLTSLAYYRRVEHAELGDRWEGIGKREINGITIELTTANEVYVLCTSTKREFRQLLDLDSAYDTIVLIDDLVGLSQAVVEAARRVGIRLFPQSGVCRYNRGNGVTKPDESVWASAWNVYEKDPKYEGQCEYRFAFYEYSSNSSGALERGYEGELKRLPEFLPLQIENPARYFSIAHCVRTT